MAHTNFYLIAGDLHTRGQQHVRHRIMDPLKGQELGLLTPLGATPPLNTFVRGASTGALGRITRVLSNSSFILESLPISTVYGTFSGAAFAAGNPLGETVNFDNGAVGIVSISAAAASYPLFQQFVSQHLDETLNKFTPEDRSDKVYWYHSAKYSRQLILTGASVIGDTDFITGFRFTTSAGASGTILLGNVSGSDYAIQIVRASGTFSPGDIITITASGQTGTILTVGIDPPTGAWLEHHVLPNLNGQTDLWEFPPAARTPDYGPGVSIVQKAYAHHVADEDPLERGVRVLPFSLTDYTNDDASLGGVTVQVVKCSGTFPTTWIAGETVTSGSWSATVHGFHAANKYLFVTVPNGEVLAAGTVTGSISGSAATSTGAAFGWQKGSTHWNNLIAEITTAMAADNSLFSGAAAKMRGVFLMPWDSEVNTFSTSVGASWPSVTKAQQSWINLVRDIRSHFSDPALPIAVWQHLSEALPSVTSGGYTYSLYMRIQIDSLPALISKLTIVRSEGFEFAHDPTISTPVPTSPTYLRADDYLTLGDRAWRAMRMYAEEIPLGNFEMFPIIVVAGQSQQVGNIPAGTLMGLDRDPLLYPSASFPGVNTKDPNCLSFNTLTGEWEVFDIAVNANHFFGMGNGTCGPETPLMARQKKRWSKVVGETGRVGLIKLAVSGSSAYAGSLTAPATWDPTLSLAPKTSVSCTVTVIAPTMSSPARGRFTAVAGTFSSGWTAGSSGFISGSALGLQGFGGNNTAPNSVTYVAAIAPDGSYIEFYGTFVAEGPRVFDLSSGPHALAPLVEEQIRLAFSKATQLGLIPYPMLLVWENGEGDASQPDEYHDALLRSIQNLETKLGGRVKGQTAIAKVIVQLSAATPSCTDEQLATIREAQVQVASELENAIIVDPTPLPMESSGTWPVLSRFDNGLHRTARGHLMCGYMVDQASGSLEGIPAHPDGDAAIDFGTDGGGLFTSSADSFTDAPTLILEDGTGVSGAQAWFDESFMDSYNENHDQVPEWEDADTDTKQKWIRQGTTYIARAYANRFKGKRTYEAQSLPFPRTGIIDPDGFEIAENSLPNALLEATAEAILRQAMGIELLPDAAAGENVSVKDIRVDTIAVRSEYLGSRKGVRTFRAIDQTLRSGGLISGTLTRGVG